MSEFAPGRAPSQAELLECRIDRAPIAVLDVETTGLDPAYGDRVIEVAVLARGGGAAPRTFSTLIDPERPLDDEASAISGITAEMLAGQPTFAAVAPALEELLAHRVLVAHNAPFDLGFLEEEFARAARPFHPGPVLDTCAFARRRMQFAGGNSLENVARALRVRNPDAHRALGDVLTTDQIFARFAADLGAARGAKVKDFLAAQGGPLWPARSLAELDDAHPLRVAIERRLTVRVRYTDSYGKVSERRLEPRAIDGRLLVAWCELRREERRFRIDRIELL